MATMKGYVQTSGNPSYPHGFYGADDGECAGPSAFDNLFALLKNLSPNAPYDSDTKNPRPMMLLVCGDMSCNRACDTFAEMFVQKSRYGSTNLIYPFVNGYFRGNDTASQAAKNFTKNTLGYTGDCHTIGFYGIAADGKEYAHAQSLDSCVKYEDFEKLIEQQITKWNEFKKSHPYPDGDIKLYTPYPPWKGTTEIDQNMSEYNLGQSWRYMISQEVHKKQWENALSDDTFYHPYYFGWQKEIQNETYHGYKESFEKLYQKSLINKRPLVLIYGGYRNYGTMIYNHVMATWQRSYSTDYGHLNNYCPYKIYYIDDGKTEEANKVRDFITQYGEIPTGYPWYMVYGYKKDGSLYVRYGSLYTQSMTGELIVKDGTTYVGGNILESSSIYERCYYLIRDCLKEIGEYYVPVEEVRYQVVFQYYDEKQVGDTQSVLSGSNATPPENPTREGYNFTKWEPSFTNVTCDLTCIAQYEKIYVPQPKGNNIRNQMTKAQLSKNILSVGDYCFYNCHKLKDVELGPYCRMIGTSAFKDCTSLSSVNRLNDSNPDHTFDIVGDYAFSNTNISSATLTLRGSSSFTFFGDYCFAYNNNLQNVRFLSSSFMSNNMFCDCSSLTSVTFDNNYTSYVYPYVFHNCTALRDITLPSKIWFLTNGMFKGCSSLSSIKFSSYDNGATNLIQDGAFNGCSSLTSIEFPQSINSLSCFEDGCFQNMPNLREIKFDGIISDDIFTQGQIEIEEDIYFGTRYEKKLYTDVLKLVDIADKANIPVVITMRKDFGCTHCTLFGANIKSEQGIENLAKHKILMIDYINCLYTTDKVHAIFKTGDVEGHPDVTNYVIYGVYWRKKDGTLKRYISGGRASWITNQGTGINRQIEDVLTRWGYDWEMTEKERAFQTTTTVDSIRKTGCFRLNHDCTLISKEGATVNFKYNPKEVEQKIEEPNYESDKSTKTDFQVGKWYYNMKQLKHYADSTQKPILGIYSLLGCDPCTIYHDNIWNNYNLQSWISSQNFYFCGIESQRQLYYDDQLRYCVQDFVISANNYLRYGEDMSKIKYNAFGEYFKETKNETTGQINTNLFTPVIMMYDPTNRVNSNGNFYLYTYHNIQKWIDQCGKDGVVEVLKRLCLYHFENNDTSSPNGFVKGVTVKFDINNLPSKEEEYEKNKYYDENTGIMNLGSYGSLEKLKSNLKSTFRDENGDYIGGCQVEQVPWMYEIGIDAEIATNYPETLKEMLESVKTYRFTDEDKYTVKLDITDTQDVYSPCSMSGIETGYRLIWVKL